jgi:hypothetical protein
VPETTVLDTFKCWGLEAARLRPDILIEGSPERCDFRTVIEDRAGLIPVLRFGLLSEWLRKRDREMLELEMVYMNLILEHREALTASFLNWRRCRS